MNRNPAALRIGHAVVSLGLAAGAVLLSACSTAPAPSPAAPPPATSTATSTSGPATPPQTAPETSAPASVDGGSPDGLTANQLHQLLVILEAVNPGVSTDETALVNGSLMVCSHIKAHESDAAVEAVATREFSNGTYQPSPEEAQAMRMAIAKTFCFG